MRHTFARFIALSGIAGSFCLMMACGKEPALHPPLIPDEYQLPQGTQPIDDSIVAFKKRYGSYILYKFTHRDFAYANGTELTDTAAPGDPAHIAGAYAFFRDECLSWYPEAFRMKTMPFRIILCAAIGMRLPGGGISPGIGFAQNRETLSIGWANAQLAGLGQAERKAVIAWMHRYYMMRAVEGASLKLPTQYVALFPISFIEMSETNMYEKGIIEMQNDNNRSLAKDLGSFIQAIAGKTTAELEAGILSPQVDRAGLIRRKYDILVRFFKEEHGVDLVAIGNEP